MLDFVLNLVSPAQVASLVRGVVAPSVTAAVAYAAAKGWIATADAAAITTLIITVVVSGATSAWGMRSHTVANQVANISQADPAQLLQTVVEAVPAVSKIETTAALAAATPSSKIVPTPAMARVG